VSCVVATVVEGGERLWRGLAGATALVQGGVAAGELVQVLGRQAHTLVLVTIGQQTDILLELLLLLLLMLLLLLLLLLLLVGEIAALVRDVLALTKRRAGKKCLGVLARVIGRALVTQQICCN